MMLFSFLTGTIFIGTANVDSSASAPADEVDLIGDTGNVQLDVGASLTDVFKLLAPLPDDDITAPHARWRVTINKHQTAQID